MTTTTSLTSERCVPGCTQTDDGHCCIVTCGEVPARSESNRDLDPIGLQVEVVQECHLGGTLTRHVALLTVDRQGCQHGDVVKLERGDVPGLIAALTTAHGAAARVAR